MWEHRQLVCAVQLHRLIDPDDTFKLLTQAMSRYSASIQIKRQKCVIFEQNIDLYSEVNLSAFVYRLFHEDFPSIDGIQSVEKTSS